MSYTLGEAAKATGKSKPTIQRAIKSGRISAERKADGSYEIDPAELHRVFPPLSVTSNDTGEMKQSVPPVTPAVLQAELDGLRGEMEQVKSERDDLRRRLDMESEERRKLTALLTDQRAEPRPEERAGKPRWIARLFGYPAPPDRLSGDPSGRKSPN